MNQKYERQMKKGVLDMVILKLLEQEVKYGYQIILDLKERSGEIFSLKEGTLYPILYRLEEDGLVESRWCEPDGKRVARKYYHITKKGQKMLQEIFNLWKNVSEKIDNIMEG